MGREIQAIKFSGEDRRVYREKVRRSLDALARMLRDHLFEDNPASVGQEIELNLVDSQALPSMRNTDVLDAIADPAWGVELGQFNLEINVPPRRLAGDALAELEQVVRDDLNAGDEKARSTGTRVMMVGILPTLRKQDMHLGTLTASDRFRVLNEQIFAARGEDMRISIDGAEKLLTHTDSITPEAACTSLQLHLQVNPESFANYWNAAQAAAAVQVALGANSPFLFGRQLWHETRITLFEQATDTRPDELKEQGVRPRVWFGERWITSVFDLFEENLRFFPALLPICEDEDPLAVLDGGACPHLAEMSLHNGTVYRWNRPIYAVVEGRPHLRVENRVLPAGPSRRRRGSERCLLLRAGAHARRGAAADLDARWRSRPPARTCTRRPAAAWTRTCTGPGSAKYRWPNWCCAACCRWPARASAAGASTQSTQTGCLASLSSAASPARPAPPGRSQRSRRSQDAAGLRLLDALRQMTERYIDHMHTNEPVHTWPVTG